MPSSAQIETYFNEEAPGIVGMKLEWNYSNSEIIERKGFGKELNLYMAKTVAQYTEKYVPWGKPNRRHSDGRLTKSVRTYSSKDYGRVVWTAPYAEAQWNGPSTWKRYKGVHPLSTSHWNEMAWTIHGSTIINKVDAKRRELSKP